MLLVRDHCKFKHTKRLKVKEQKKIYCANSNHKKAGMVKWVSEKYILRRELLPE